MHGDSRRDERDLVLVGRTKDAATAYLELLVRTVDHRRVRPERADVRDSLEICHGRDELCRLVAVARMQNGAAVHRAKGREVLEAHLRGAVLADRDARVRAREAVVRAADRGHADEVVGT